MPMYEYYCKDCNATFEMIVPYQHADDVICTKCHSEKVRRKLSLFATAHGDGDEFAYSDAMPSAGSCSCGGNCGCH